MSITQRFVLTSLLLATGGAISSQALFCGAAVAPAGPDEGRSGTSPAWHASSLAPPHVMPDRRPVTPPASVAGATAVASEGDLSAASEVEFSPFHERLGSVDSFEQSPYFNPTATSLDRQRRRQLDHLIAAFNIELADVGEERQRLKEALIETKLERGQYTAVGEGGIRVTRDRDAIVTGVRYLDAATAVRVEVRRGEFADLDANLAREALLKDRARQMIRDLFADATG